MGVQSGKPLLPASSPLEAAKGEHDSLLLIMSGLRENPVSGRLLRGLSPYLDEQGARHVVLLTERRRREPWSDSEEVDSASMARVFLPTDEHPLFGDKPWIRLDHFF